MRWSLGQPAQFLSSSMKCLSLFPPPLLSSPGEETQCTLNILLSSPSRRRRRSCSYNSQWFWRCSSRRRRRGGAAVIFLHFSFQTASELERPSAVPRQQLPESVKPTQFKGRAIRARKFGNHAISERSSTPSSSSVSDNISPCEQINAFASSVRRTGCGCLVNGFEKKIFFK